MPKKFPDMKDGDVLEPRNLNISYREHERWSKVTGTGTVDVLYADSNSPPVIYGRESDPIFTVLLTTTIATGGTYGTPTSGTGTILRPKFSAPGYDSSGTSETIYHTDTHTITSGTLARCFRDIDGFLYVLVANC